MSEEERLQTRRRTLEGFLKETRTHIHELEHRVRVSRETIMKLKDDEKRMEEKLKNLG